MRYLPFFAAACLATISSATVIKEVSFEDLVASSDQIVLGHVNKSWTSWGPEHKLIWTRYQVAVDDVLRGPRTSTLVVSEPGGTLDGKTMRVESAVRYSIGEHVTLFLHQFPSGDKRTVGWSQGKFTIDAQDRVHASPGAGYVPRHAAGTSLAAIDGITYKELRQRVAALPQKGITR